MILWYYQYKSRTGMLLWVLQTQDNDEQVNNRFTDEYQISQYDASGSLVKMHHTAMKSPKFSSNRNIKREINAKLRPTKIQQAENYNDEKLVIRQMRLWK